MFAAPRRYCFGKTPRSRRPVTDRTVTWRREGGRMNSSSSIYGRRVTPQPNQSPTAAAANRSRRRRGWLGRVTATTNSVSMYLREAANKELMMNRYARIAQAHWKQVAPMRYRSLAGPEKHFEELGQAVAAQVARVSAAMEASLPTDLDYPNRAGQLAVIQKQAEEQALADLAYSVTPEPSLREELDLMLS